MPVDDGADIKIVGQIDPEPLAGVEDQPLTAGTDKAKDGCGASIDIEGPGRGGEADRRRPLRKGDAGHLCRANGGGACGKKAAS